MKLLIFRGAHNLIKESREGKNMPKLKSNSGAKKRFKITKNGKIKRSKGFKSHLLESKSSKRKRNLRGVHVTSEVEASRIKKMLPYA